jgi:2-amino-4-hydroxy-6-hydroxymethyldihydropteridine diphosphokinase
MSASSLRARVADTAAPIAEALIALGGNIGDVRATFDRAVACLCRDDAVQLIARSSEYRTPPWGMTEQPAFINAAVAVRTSLQPHDLLARALDCERKLGLDRARKQHWGPRLIDIDIVAYGDVALTDPDLVLPHPHLWERAFVLVPLAEIAPDRLIAGVRVRDALTRVDARGIERLPPH